MEIVVSEHELGFFEFDLKSSGVSIPHVRAPESETPSSLARSLTTSSTQESFEVDAIAFSDEFFEA